VAGEHWKETFGPAILFYNRGKALERQGHNEEAAAAYAEATRLDPGDVDAQVRLGLVLRDLGRDEEANQAFQNALELHRSAAGGPTNDPEPGR
jgi:Flp pilus assembly protein TadD